ncbi:MAG: methylated-DNA--[Clostridia bacterium]|nr:methylated-DNA--[protein]-cysteine S-methyltransferase [Clostridia bacterium]
MEAVFHYDSPLGGMTMTGRGDTLTGLWFDGQKHFMSGLTGGEEERLLPVFEETINWLDKYFAGRPTPPVPKTAPRGTPYQKALWEVLSAIPYGGTMTYKDAALETARRVGRKPCPRAAGAAAGRNPILIIIPCHRLIASDGSMGGYAAGVDRKIRLLETERRALESISAR